MAQKNNRKKLGKILALRIHTEMLEVLEEEANKKQVSLSWLVRQYLKKALPDKLEN